MRTTVQTVWEIMIIGLVKKHKTKYGQFEPINFMCKTFNDFINHIDFSYSVSVQRKRLCELELNSVVL